MKYVIIFLLITFNTFSLANNEIIAIVNQKILTLQSIKSELDLSSTFERKLKVVNDRVDILLQLELVEQYNLKPSEFDINNALKFIAKENNISIDKLEKSPNFKIIKSDVIKNLSIFKLKFFLTKDLIFDSTINEVKTYCQGIDNNYIKQIKIAEIVIIEPPESSVNKIEKDKKIKSFLKTLSNHISMGASFTNLAKLHSQSPSYLNGGISEWKNIKTDFLLEVNKLPKNTLSNIYQIDNGWAIAIKIDERKVNIKLEECKKDISNKKADKFFENYMIKYRNKADINIFEKKL